MNIQGHYLDGKTSREQFAQLQYSDSSEIQIVFSGEKIPASEDFKQETFTLDFHELKIESRLGNTLREISFGENQLFVTPDNDAVDELILKLGSSESISLLHRLESSLPTIIASVIVTVILMAATVVYGIPKAAEVIAFKLPDFATSKLGSGLDVLDKTVFDPSALTPSRQQEIRSLFAPHLERFEDLNPKLEFRSGMKANAFAMPGGEIVLTDDFVDLVKDDEELLAILYHELGHLKHRHITRRALQGSMITLIVVFVTGDLDTLDLLTGLPTIILDLSYSRDFEREADQFALEHMRAAGIPTENFALAMEHLEEYYADEDEGDSPESSDADGESWIDYLSSHPPTQERIDSARDFR